MPFTILLAVAMAVGSSTQQAEAVAEPETLNVVYGLSQGSGSLTELERVMPELKQKVKLLGLAGAEVLVVIEDSSASSVRLPEGAEFVVRLPSGINPGIFKLYRFESKDDRRELQVTAGAWYRTGGSNVDAVSLDVQAYGEGSYKLVPRELEPGEYCFNADAQPEAFCFGID